MKRFAIDVDDRILIIGGSMAAAAGESLDFGLTSVAKLGRRVFLGHNMKA